MSNSYNYDHLRNLTIGTVDYVSPNEIKVILDTSAPQNTALNTGTPSLFPRINGFVLIPNEVGALVGLICWIGVEHSQYPKRKGYKDFDLIDLPYPLRKMSITPMGTLKQKGKIEDKMYTLERGIYSFPSIGDMVSLPTDIQLRSIVENKEDNSVVKIGTAPIAGNADVRINPDKFFGRHVAILGNTGSGKSCSVAGVIRWSLEAAAENLPKGQKTLNTRFIILDPNGEYTKSFNGLQCNIKNFKVELTEEEKSTFHGLKVPAWLWNSYEWSSFSNASGRTQRPILRRALRELRAGQTDGLSDFQTKVRNHFSSCCASLKRNLAASSDYKDSATSFGFRLVSLIKDSEYFEGICENEDLKPRFKELSDSIKQKTDVNYRTFPKDGKVNEYYVAFSRKDVEDCLEAINRLLENFGGLTLYTGPNEDTPIPFNITDLPNHVERLSHEAGVIQFVDFLIMRIRSMLSDTRMNKIIADAEDVSLENWLSETIDGISIIDLSLVPSDITHLIISVISRVIFESLQRYRKINNKVLPTVIVMEEAHNFIKRYGYGDSGDEITASQLCTESFEKIAREGRKFGLSLTLSSQRPSELSPTVLSQCNTFLLHRIVNDRDQELVKRLVPDNIGGLLQELPVLPTRKAILLGWAAPLPILVEMNELKSEHRPKSDDPDFWDVWTRKKERAVDWKKLADNWQDIASEDVIAENIDNEEETPPAT